MTMDVKCIKTPQHRKRHFKLSEKTKNRKETNVPIVNRCKLSTKPATDAMYTALTTSARPDNSMLPCTKWDPYRRKVVALSPPTTHYTSASPKGKNNDVKCGIGTTTLHMKILGGDEAFKNRIGKLKSNPLPLYGNYGRSTVWNSASFKSKLVRAIR